MKAMVDYGTKIELTKTKTTAVLQMLSELGVSASLVGSLPDGRFGDFSDVDFLVSSCPKRLKYKLEALVEDMMGDIKFDLVYAEEVPAHVLKKMKASLRVPYPNE